VFQVEKNGYWGYFEVQTTFLPVGSMNPTKLAEKVCFGVSHNPTKFQAKLIARKFYLGKKQNLHLVPKHFSGSIFGHNLPTS